MPTETSSAVRRTDSLCAYCGVGCGLVIEVDALTERITRTVGRPDHPSNAGRLCTKGTTTAAMLNGGGRLDRPLIRPRRGAGPQPADLDHAIAETAARLRAIIDRDGPDAVAFYVSGQMSLEAQYLATKLAKGFIGTNQIESNSRLCMASASTGYKQSLGADGPPGSYDDLDHADVFLVIGANMADCHPVLFGRMMTRVKAGATLIVVDPRRTATAAAADLFLQITPATDLAFLNGLLHLLIADDALDHDFIAAHTEGFADLTDLVAQYPPTEVARITGIAEDDLRAAATLLGRADNWMSCWTMGLNQSTHGTWNTNALINLHLATGAICRRGSGPFSLTGQPNAMGGREMGYLGPGLPGQRSVTSAADREFVEQQWGLPPGTIRADPGGGTIDMFAAMAAGDITACWIMATNPVASVANRATVIDSLERAELVVTSDAFADTETNGYADIALPAALWSEAQGVMVNSERTLTLFEPAVRAPGQAIPDWQIIARVATAMGYAAAFDYADAAEIFDEIRRFHNPATGYDLRGITYERLRQAPTQWPCAPDSTDARNPIRYLNDGISQTPHVLADGSRPALAFATPSRRARFFARPHLAPAEMPDDAYPFLLNTGRLPHQWHTMTKTRHVPALNKLDPGPFIEINPGDATGLGVADGDPVEVASRRGRAVLPARVSDRVRPGDCFAPFHWNDSFGEHLAINAVTSDAVDADSRQPEFKVCAVTLTKVTTRVPAAPPSVPAPSGALAERLGVADVTMPEPTATERFYLAGFVAGMGAAPANTPVLPADNPLRPELHTWLAGYLAAAHPASPVGGAALDPAPAATVTVLWASQLGTAEDYAADLIDRLAASGLAVTGLPMDDADPRQLCGTALFVSSTTGDGDPPHNGVAFWDGLAADDASTLDDLTFAVLAFGDRGYDDFCGHGRRLDARLAELGGTRILERVDCERDVGDTAETWATTVLDALQGTPRRGGARRTGTQPSRASVQVVEPERPGTSTTGYSRRNPLRTTITHNTRLSGPNSLRDVRNIGLDVGAALDYQAGDSLGVWPVNSDELVDEWLSHTGLAGETEVPLGNERMPLRLALRERLDFANLTPAMLGFVADRSGAPDLRALVESGDRDEFDRWAWGRQSVDLLAEHSVAASVEEWLAVLNPIQPRSYSISSSPRHSPDIIELTVSAVRYNRFGTARGGVCSTFLADRAAREVGVFVTPTVHFRPPTDPDIPMIMIGAGTGIAPFRGFLRDRAAAGHGGPNWLFFGAHHRATDFYYRDELTTMLADGLLTRLDVAFSRDQETRIHVQDRITEHGAELYRWLHDGAHVYVCGDAARMARDVDLALKGVIAQHGRLSPASADAYVKALAAEKRYVRDVY